MQKGINRIFIIIPAALILIAAIVLVSLYLNGFFYDRREIKVTPASSDAEIAALPTESRIVPQDMLSRTLTLLNSQTFTAPYVISWYALPGSISSITAYASEYLVTSDQVALLRCYVEAGDKDSARELANAIEKDFTGADGFLVPGQKITDLPAFSGLGQISPPHAEFEELPPETAYSMEATIGYVRALMEYYNKWGLASDWTRIEKFADALYSSDGFFFEDQTITDSLNTPVPTGANQDIVSAAEGQMPTGGSFTTLSLSALDLEVFRMLSEADSKYTPMYTSASDILSGALISSDLPLYAIGYTQSSAGYVYFTGETAQADLILSLKVTLHLVEAGLDASQTLLWIKEQMYNEGMLFTNYDLISGQATTTVEAVEAYGIILQIAVKADDRDLYGVALKRLESHLATSTTSAASGTIFRQMDNSRVVVFAKDNLETLLGV